MQVDVQNIRKEYKKGSNCPIIGLLDPEDGGQIVILDADNSLPVDRT
jgi:hypothetical protein